MKFKLANLLIFGTLLSACSAQSSNFTEPAVGTCDEFSYNKKSSIATYVQIPVQGQVKSSARDVHIEIQSTLTISGYPVLACKGQQNQGQNQKIVEIDLVCRDGSYGKAFINLVHDKEYLGNGLFLLSNGTYGTLQFGDRLRESFQM